MLGLLIENCQVKLKEKRERNGQSNSSVSTRLVTHYSKKLIYNGNVLLLCWLNRDNEQVTHFNYLVCHINITG